MSDAVAETLAAIPKHDADAAVRRLATEYALAIDEAEYDVARVGAALLSCLNALGATPAARSRGGRASDKPASTRNPLDELRARRAKRAG